jgi:hypothetical protein|tara:strand:- start:507 stop:884 length:378 start_codon:yes stop_codon:yes gene_type:complete
MQIKYRIISVDEAEHSMVVRYFTDTTTEEDLALPHPDTGAILGDDGLVISCRTDVNITLFDVPLLEGDALEQFISRFAPKAWFEVIEKVKDPDVDTGLSPIAAMVGQERNAVEVPDPTPETADVS